MRNMHGHAERCLKTVTRLEKCCDARGIRLTAKQREVCRTLSGLIDHPDAERVVAEVASRYPSISRGTVYRTLNLLEEAGILLRHKFGTRTARYEEALPRHYHLIDTDNGRIIEFRSERIDILSQDIAAKLGYTLSNVKLELYGAPDEALGKKLSNEIENVD